MLFIVKLRYKGRSYAELNVKFWNEFDDKIYVTVTRPWFIGYMHIYIYIYKISKARDRLKNFAVVACYRKLYDVVVNF